MTFFSQDFTDNLIVTGYFLGQRIQVKNIPGLASTGGRAYVVMPGDGGVAYIFRYGAVVLIGMNAAQEKTFLETAVEDHLVNPLLVHETESAVVVVDPAGQNTVSFEHISVQQVTPVMLEVISDIIAKSAVLSHYERRVMEIFDILDPLADSLQSGIYPTARRSRVYLKHIGIVLAMQRKMVGQVEMTDKPEILWEQAQHIHRFYGRLEDEYEIVERHTALKEKLETIHHTAETMVDLLQTRQSLRVEWYIVILIVFDIVLTLWEKFGHYLIGFFSYLLKTVPFLQG